MPPTGALKTEQIDTIKRWIDQGTDWPDALANEAELPPINPKAVALVDALHDGDLPKFMQLVAEDDAGTEATAAVPADSRNVSALRRRFRFAEE